MGARDEFNEAQLQSQSGPREYTFSAADFERVRRMIYARAGISLNESKQNMVYSRLSRRLRTWSMGSFDEYLDRLERDPGFATREDQEFVNALTTNLTAFFRESHHFPVLADFLKRGDARIWCAAASTGEEPYSLAITLLEARGSSTGSRIVASDIDTNVLATAARGVYRADSVQSCGEARVKRWFLKGSGRNEGMVRVKPELQKPLEFRQLNLLDADFPGQRGMAEGFDVVFCRNVMIYFDKPTQRQVLERIARVLRKGGLLFVGHSENFSDSRDLFTLRGKTVYERVG